MIPIKTPRHPSLRIQTPLDKNTVVVQLQEIPALDLLIMRYEGVDPHPLIAEIQPARGLLRVVLIAVGVLVFCLAAECRWVLDQQSCVVEAGAPEIGPVFVVFCAFGAAADRVENCVAEGHAGGERVFGGEAGVGEAVFAEDS